MTNKGRRPARENIDPNATNNRSEADRAEVYPVIEHLLIQNLSDTEIAKITGVDRKAVAHLRKTSARKPVMGPQGHVQKGQESDRLNGEILRLRAEGLNYVEIAEQVGLSWTSVRARLRVAYKDYMLEMRDAVAGRQVADLEVVRNELLEIIIRADDMELSLEEFEDELAEGNYANLIKKVQDKARTSQDYKFKAMEVLLKLLDREAKLYGLDADKTMNVNHNIKVEPAAIELLGRLENRQIDDTIDGEVVEDWDMGNL